MRFIHLSDLHIGKRLCEFNLIEDQKYILSSILGIIDEKKADAVIIAGDVYDKSMPSAEAVELFDWFLTRLSDRKLSIFIISGNHDSAERIAFGSEIMDKNNIYISPVFKGEIKKHTLTDKYGNINVYMLPFVKPAVVRAVYPDEEISSYTDAVRVALKDTEIDKKERNIIITHQFVTGADKSGSEEINVGGSDNVDASVFDAFDYVALGHIHSSQPVFRDTIRYCGTPLKYSFSECIKEKSVCIVDVLDKDDIKTSFVTLKPLRDMHIIKGTYMELTAKNYYDSLERKDYYSIVLTDEEDIPDAVAKLRVIYPNLMEISYDNKRTRTDASVENDENIKAKTPYEIFNDFYESINNQGVSPQQKEILNKLIEQIWEDAK